MGIAHVVTTSLSVLMGRGLGNGHATEKRRLLFDEQTECMPSRS